MVVAPKGLTERRCVICAGWIDPVRLKQRAKTCGAVCGKARRVAQERARYAQNPEKARERKRAWTEANPEKAAYQRWAWYEANREKVLERRRARYWENKKADALNRLRLFLGQIIFAAEELGKRDPEFLRDVEMRLAAKGLS